MEIKAQAYHLGKPFKLNEVDQLLNFQLVKREASFRLYSINEETWIYVKRFGAIVFMDCDFDLRTSVLEKLAAKEGLREELPYEEYIISVGEQRAVEVDFDSIYVPELTVDTAHIIMFNLGQSVALENYFNQSTNLLKKVEKYASELANSGKISLTKKAMRKFIGKTLILKNNISKNLYIFETSDLAWNEESLTIIDRQMSEELELKERYKGLQNQLDTIHENLEFLNDIMQHKYSSLLEWIIIILIFIEIVQLIIERII